MTSETFNIEEYLNSDLIDITRPSVEELVEALERSSRIQSRQIILNLLAETSVRPQVADVMRRWSRCEKWSSRRVLGYDRTIYTRCNHPLCPACCPRLKLKEARRVWGLLERAADWNLTHESISYCTVIIGYVPIGGDFNPMLRQAKSALRNIRNRQFSYSAWAMEFEIELQSNETGKLHGHALVWHPLHAREEIAEVLRKKFPFDRDVAMHPLHSARLEREVVNAGKYKSDIDLRVRGWGWRTPEILEKYVASYESIRSRGRFGLRFEMGLHKKKQAR